MALQQTIDSAILEAQKQDQQTQASIRQQSADIEAQIQLEAAATQERIKAETARIQSDFESTKATMESMSYAEAGFRTLQQFNTAIQKSIDESKREQEARKEQLSREGEQSKQDLLRKEAEYKGQAIAAQEAATKDIIASLKLNLEDKRTQDRLAFDERMATLGGDASNVLREMQDLSQILDFQIQQLVEANQEASAKASAVEKSLKGDRSERDAELARLIAARTAAQEERAKEDAALKAAVPSKARSADVTSGRMKGAYVAATTGGSGAAVVSSKDGSVRLTHDDRAARELAAKQEADARASATAAASQTRAAVTYGDASSFFEEEQEKLPGSLGETVLIAVSDKLTQVQTVYNAPATKALKKKQIEAAVRSALSGISAKNYNEKLAKLDDFLPQ